MKRCSGLRPTIASCCLMIATLAAGCATPPAVRAPDPAPVSAPDAAAQSWWYVRFRMHWPQGEDPNWAVDLLLADRVLGPVLADNGDDISLWRFHRRAVRDGAGHQFSFIARTTAATIVAVNEQVRVDPLLEWLQRNGTVASVIYEDPANNQRPAIEDTSDRVWAPEMQRAWPHFIQGVSQLWLELIREIDASGEWPEEPLARYTAISDALNQLWLHQGGHALLHHLSAVFGYREVNVLRREQMRF